MKKIFTLAMAACLGMSAYAQDPSAWKKGQDVTEQLSWKAYKATAEDVENPAWQGFDYVSGGSWEFRSSNEDIQFDAPSTGDGNTRDNFICWGIYNVSSDWDIYQEFEMPAGVYTLSLDGCYRQGTTDNTFDLWKKNEKNQKCFVYAQVGEDVYESAMMWMFGDLKNPQTEILGNFDSWMVDNGHDLNGTKIYGPSCHNGADLYIANGNYTGNEVTFVVPEAQTIRVGIKRTGAVAEDQGWWNNWSISYQGAYDEKAKGMHAYKAFAKLQDEYNDYASSISDSFGILGAFMADEIMAIGEDLDQNNCTPEEVAAEVEKLETAHKANKAAATKAQALATSLKLCKGVAAATDFAGKADFQAQIEAAEAMISPDTEEADYKTIDEFCQKADDFNKARVNYLLSQDKAEDGSQDFTQAINAPWFVNNEYTPHLSYVQDNGKPVYAFPEPVETEYFGDNAPGWTENGVNPENGKVKDSEEVLTVISDLAKWTTDPNAEGEWRYVKGWTSWTGFTNQIQTIGGYLTWYSGWSSTVNDGKIPDGITEVSQVVNGLPDGFYTLEGRLFTGTGDGGKGSWTEDEYAQVKEHLFAADAEGNEIASVYTTQDQYLSVWGCNGGRRGSWITLTTDYFQINGGKATFGYKHNTMAGNAGLVLKYYGKELDYSGLVQKKINEITNTYLKNQSEEEGDEVYALYAGDRTEVQKLIDEVKIPIAGADAYKVAQGQLSEAESYARTAKSGKDNFKVAENYLALASAEENEDVAGMLTTAQFAADQFGAGEEDTYLDAKEYENVYNEYVAYINVFKKANASAQEKTKAEAAAQKTALEAEYPTLEELIAKEKALATLLNGDAFAEMGSDKASEENPMDITDLFIVNADLSQGPKTGWTLEGSDCNPGINTYGREVAECWNQQPFTISQTFRSLPEGVYEFSVRACYRSAGGVGQEMVNNWLENGNSDNAVIFANDATENLADVCSLQAFEPSFSEYYNGKAVADEIINVEFADGHKLTKDWDGTVYISNDEYAEISSLVDEDAFGSITEGLAQIDLSSPAYPFDTKIGDGEEAMFFPSSMAGFQNAIAKDETAYVNKVRVIVEEGGDLQVGIRKNVANGGDWIIFDDFKLAYLGNDKSLVEKTGINDVTVKSEKNAIYNIAGQRLNSLQKGINIVNGKKIYVK